MEILHGAPSDEAVLDAIRRWVGLLAADDFEAAVHYLYQGAGASRGSASAPELRAWLARYEAAAPLSQEPTRVTRAETAGGPLEPLEYVVRTDDGTLIAVDFSMPINGEWSELVAFFDVVPVPGGHALMLRDMYVA